MIGILEFGACQIKKNNMFSYFKFIAYPTPAGHSVSPDTQNGHRWIELKSIYFLLPLSELPCHLARAIVNYAVQRN
jgi:hypothetical protein